MSQENYSRTLNTPEFRGGFMNVFEPKKLKRINPETKEHEQGFQLTMLFQDGEDLADIKAAANEIMVDKFGPDKTKWPKRRSEKNPNGFKVPWRDQEEKDPDNEEAEKTYSGYKSGNLFMNATTKAFNKDGTPRKIEVVDYAVKPVIDRKLIYSGAYYIANVNLYWYENESKGFALSFNCVQKTRDGEPLGGNRVTAASVFSPVKANKSKAAADAFSDEDEEDPLA